MNPGLTLHLAEAPYLGLRPFEVAEADIFFGRERQTDELLRRLSQTYFLPIVGPSGCGKSSLVRAGLLASLESGFIVEAGGRWRVLTMMPRGRPIEELANAILRRLSDSDESKLLALQAVLRSGPRGLIDAMKEISTLPGENLLLLVDQFEEIFRFRDQHVSRNSVDGASSQDQRRKDEADAFVGLLLETVKEKAAYVVLTMRSDFLRDCSFFAGLPEAFNKSIYLTPRLDRDDLQSAIQEPARVLGGSLEPELVRQLINDAGNNQDQLPLMQHVLMRMWSDVLQKRPNEPVELTLNDYVSVGELSKALCKDADQAFEKELSAEQQRIAEVMFKALCVRGSSDRDTRAPARVDHVAKIAGVKWEEVVPVVDVFRGTGRYFLSPRTGTLASDTVLDITHESLIRNWTKLSEWVEEEALSADTYQRLVRDALDWKNGGDVLSPIRLSSVVAWEKRFQPTEPWSQRYGGQFALAMEYLQASREQREKEAREAALVQQRLFLKENAVRVLGTALVIALGVVGWATYQMQRANANYGSALAIKAQLEWRSQKTLSAWPYAVAAPLHNKSIKLDELSARNAQPFIHYFRQIHHDAKVSALAISPDGKRLAAALSNGGIDLVDPQTGTLVHFAASPSAVNADSESSAAKGGPNADKGLRTQLAFSPDGKLLYCSRHDLELEIRSLPEGKVLLPPAFAAGKKTTSLAVDRSGALALGLSNGKLIFSRNGSESPVVPLASPTMGAISFLAFSADGKKIVGISGGSLRAWQIESAQVLELEVEAKGLEQNQNEAAARRGPQRIFALPTPTPSPPPLSTVLFSPKGNDTLMLAHQGEKIELARYTQRPVRNKENSSSSTTGTATTGDGRQLVRPASQSDFEQALPEPSEHAPRSVLGFDLVESFPLQKNDDLGLPKTSRSYLPKTSLLDKGNVVAATGPSGAVFYWVTGDGRLTAWWPARLNLGNENSQLFVKAHEGAATALGVSPSGSWLATGGVDQATRIWRVATDESLARGATETLPPIQGAMTVDPQGKIIAVGKDRFGTRRSRDEAIQLFPDLESEEIPLWLSDDGKSVVVSSGRTVRIIDTATFQQRARIEGAKPPLAFNGPILAAMESGDKTGLSVALWDASTGERLGRIPAAKDKIVDVMFGSAGRDLVAIATDKNRLTIWDIHDPSHPREARSMSTGEAKIDFITFAEAENRVAAASSNKVILFDAKTTAQVAIPVAGSPTHMIFNAKGTLLVIALQSGLVKVWDCEKSQERQEIPEIPGSARSRRALAVTSGEEIVTAEIDEMGGVINVWNLAGQLVKTFAGSDWRPKSVKDAARLSGLVVEDLGVRFLKPEEEMDLKIDASVPLEEEGLADYWSAAWRTDRNFAMLKKLDEVEKADFLKEWLSKHSRSSDIGTQVRAKMAKDLSDNLRRSVAKKVGVEAFLSGDQRSVLDVFERVVGIDPSAATAESLAWRGFARHLAGDERGALEDRQSCLRAVPKLNIRSLDGSLRRPELNSRQLLLIGTFLTWLEPDYMNGHRYQAQAHYGSKRYNEALAEVNEAIRLQNASVDTSKAADVAVDPAMASLLLLRGRVLEVQRSPEARKDFQQVVDGLAALGIVNETKAFAQLHLGKFDPANFGAAKDYFAEQTRRYFERSLSYYNLACFFAIRSASSGADENARTNDVTAAIDALQKGVTRTQYFSLRTFVDTTSDLLPLKNDPRFTAILEKEERARQTSESGDSE